MTQDPEANSAALDRDRELDELCERWVDWCATRRLSAIAAPVDSGHLRGSIRPIRTGSSELSSSALMSAFHTAYTCQPKETLSRKVFDMYYVRRIKPVKTSAAALGISSSQFYRLLGVFRRQVVTAAETVFHDAGRSRGALMDVLDERDSGP
ncbi:hypothetical protein BH11PSE13_BH11PSE13_12300 [soil metagenome]